MADRGLVYELKSQGEEIDGVSYDDLGEASETEALGLLPEP